MDILDKLLEYVRRTNPEMTRDKLINELNKNHYSSVGIVFILQNFKI